MIESRGLRKQATFGRFGHCCTRGRVLSAVWATRPELDSYEGEWGMVRQASLGNEPDCWLRSCCVFGRRGRRALELGNPAPVQATAKAMPQRGLPAAQQLATSSDHSACAKSGSEITRLPAESHQLLNLHRRKRSTISHRERWTDYEIRLLGRIRDDELAKLVRRSPGAVAGKRESLDIPTVPAAAHPLGPVREDPN